MIQGWLCYRDGNEVLAQINLASSYILFFYSNNRTLFQIDVWTICELSLKTWPKPINNAQITHTIKTYASLLLQAIIITYLSPYFTEWISTTVNTVSSLLHIFMAPRFMLRALSCAFHAIYTFCWAAVIKTVSLKHVCCKHLLERKLLLFMVLKKRKKKKGLTVFNITKKYFKRSHRRGFYFTYVSQNWFKFGKDVILTRH